MRLSVRKRGDIMRQKTKTRLSRIALLIASTILLVNLGSLFSRTEVMAEGTALQDSAAITLVDIYVGDGNGNNVSLVGTNPPSVTYNADYIYVDLEWAFPDGPGVVSPGQSFTYALPDSISFNSASDTLRRNGKDVGRFDVSEHSITITYFNDANGIEFCNGNDRISELTFSGQVIGDVTNANLPASITASFPGVANPVTINMDIPTTQTSLEVNKDDCTEIDANNHRYQYNAYVISHGTNNEVVISDWPSAGQDIDTATFGIFTDEAGNNPYTGTYTMAYLTNTGFRFTVDSMADGEKIYIRYQVTIRPELYDPNGDRSFIGNSYGVAGYHGNVSNTFEAVSNTSPAAVDYYDIGTYAVKINKYHADNIVDDGLIGWDIYIYKFDYDISDLYVIDTLPANTVFAAQGFSVTGGDDYTNLVQYEVLPNNQVRIDLNDPAIINYLRNTSGANVHIKYYVKVTQQETTRAVYVNNAKLYGNGGQIDEATADAAFEMPPVIEKTGRYDTATAPNALFTITVNPLALNVDTTDSHDTLTLVDTFPETYDLQVASVVISRDDGGALTTESYTYDENTKILTLTLRDQTAYTITYRGTVNRRVGTQLDQNNSNNTIAIDGILPVIADGYYFHCVVVRSAGSASSTNPNAAMLNVIKHEEGDTTAVLQGAQFTLTAMTIGSSNTLTAGAAVVQTTDANGTAYFEVDRERIYMLTETLAPTGYELNEDIYFYAFADTNSTLPATVTYNGQTYTVTIIESDRVSRDVYFADEAATVNIVDPTPPATPTNPAVGGTTNNTTPTTTTEPTTGSSAPATTTAPSETTAAAETVTTSPTIPVSTGDIDSNAVNGAGRGMATSEAGEAAVTTTTTTGAVTSTGESLSYARILGVLTIFVSFLFLILIRWERKEGMYEGNKYI